jgi:CDP-diacylglycerol pyrophosphatase
MCGCPEDFVHGLVVPRTRVTGVEDPRRPDGIWDFAWAAALKKICNPQTAALAVNPVAKRAQDQLHVHIVRLEPDARQRLLKAHATRVDKLGEVWSAAGKVAAAAGLADYGVLVAAHPEGGFIVAVDSVSPEKSYGVERCQ